MLSRLKTEIVKPNPKYALLSSMDKFVELATVKVALEHPDWLQAMKDELVSLEENDTWQLVPKTSDMHVIGTKWVFKIKYKADNTIEMLKARFIEGYNQQGGVDVSETFSPVVKPATVRIVLSLTTHKKKSVHQFDVNNAFINGVYKKLSSLVNHQASKTLGFPLMCVV